MLMDRGAGRPEDLGNLGDCLKIVLDMFENLRGHDCVKYGLPKGEVRSAPAAVLWHPTRAAESDRGRVRLDADY